MSEQTTYDLPDACLLRALDDAHEKGFRDFLRKNRHDERCQAHRKRAADALSDLIGGLKKGSVPDYHNQDVAAAYIVKYHLSHCMMAYWVFKSIFDRRDIPDTLYVYDVGAGTGAGRVGLALALSEHQGQSNGYYEAFEPSKAMQSAGDCFWEAFRGFVGDNPKDSDSVPEFPAGTLKIVTAFHLSLPWERSEVEEHTINSVQSAICQTSPHLGLFTCHKDKWASLRKVVGDYYDWDRKCKVSIHSGGNGVPSRSTFYTHCAPSLGFQVDEGSKINTWSRYRFRLPSESILLRQERKEAEAKRKAEEEERLRKLEDEAKCKATEQERLQERKKAEAKRKTDEQEKLKRERLESERIEEKEAQRVAADYEEAKIKAAKEKRQQRLAHEVQEEQQKRREQGADQDTGFEAIPDEMLTESEKRHEKYRRQQAMAGRFTPAAERLPIMTAEERAIHNKDRPKRQQTSFEGPIEKLIEKYQDLKEVQRHLTLGQSMKYEFTSDGRVLDKEGNVIFDGEKIVDKL